LADLNTRMPSGSDVTQCTDKQPAFSVQAAVACGITSKGPWRSAKTPGINQALSLDYLKSEGLYSLRDGWIALHYPK